MVNVLDIFALIKHGEHVFDLLCVLWREVNVFVWKEGDFSRIEISDSDASKDFLGLL